MTRGTTALCCNSVSAAPSFSRCVCVCVCVFVCVYKRDLSALCCNNVMLACCLLACMHACTYTYIYVYIFIYVYICKYINIPKRGHVTAETGDSGRPSGRWKRGEGSERGWPGCQRGEH
jgi:hypothetical protein